MNRQVAIKGRFSFTATPTTPTTTASAPDYTGTSKQRPKVSGFPVLSCHIPAAPTADRSTCSQLLRGLQRQKNPFPLVPFFSSPPKKGNRRKERGGQRADFSKKKSSILDHPPALPLRRRFDGTAQPEDPSGIYLFSCLWNQLIPIAVCC